ncbi:MAG: TPM domain-containing protein [Sphingomonadales bacterium]|nr:TPM domain-containing protein [Sphingomonadales bacterium]
MFARWLAGLLLVALAAMTNPALAQTFPPLSGRVVDAANILPPDFEARLNQKLEALDSQSHRQLVVATVPDLQGYEISDYGYRLGRAWGIGSQERNDGALLIVAPNERKVRVEVGYGLEGIVTDGWSTLLIQKQILPQFRAGNMPAGIEAGVDALAAQLALPPDQARALAAQAQPAPEPQGATIDLPTIIFLLFILFFVVIPIIRSMRGGRRYRGSGPVVIWGGGGSGWGGGGGFSGGGGGFGGGGFSGGGGSFGGGGASGSW